MSKSSFKYNPLSPVEFLVSHPRCTIEKISAGLGVDKSIIEKDILKALKNGIVFATGANGDIEYEVSSEFLVAQGFQTEVITSKEREDRLDQLQDMMSMIDED
jgi:hypothetical protein